MVIVIPYNMNNKTLTQQHIHNICDKIRQLPVKNQKTVYKIIKQTDPKVRIRITHNHVSVVMTDCNLTTLHIIEKYIDSLTVKKINHGNILGTDTDTDSDTITNIIHDMKDNISDCNLNTPLNFTSKEQKLMFRRMKDKYMSQ